MRFSSFGLRAMAKHVGERLPYPGLTVHPRHRDRPRLIEPLRYAMDGLLVANARQCARQPRGFSAWESQAMRAPATLEGTARMGVDRASPSGKVDREGETPQFRSSRLFPRPKQEGTREPRRHGEARDPVSSEAFYLGRDRGDLDILAVVQAR